MNIYLDIDGVLLANDNNAANYVHEFLEKVNSTNNKVYWLTTHCRGDSTTAVQRLSKVFPSKTLQLTKTFLPTSWKIAKTEAIDFTEPFLWFDDDLFDDERKYLEKQGALDSWIEVDLAKNPDKLRDFVISFPLALQV
jgi:hypothetical protein